MMATPSRTCPEESVFYGLLVAIGSIPVVVAVVQQVPFGVEATLGLAMVGSGLIGAISSALRARAG